MERIGLRLIIVVIACAAARADNPLGLVANYSQNNNTYLWENSYRRVFTKDRFASEFNFNTSSTLIKKPYKRWQENLDAKLDLGYAIADGLRLKPYFSYGRNALQERIVYSSDLKLSLPFTQLSHMQVAPFIGGKSLKRSGGGIDRTNTGFGYGISSSSRSLSVWGQSLAAKVSYEAYDLDRIPFSQSEASLLGLKEWSGGDSLSWRVFDTEVSKKYYSAIGETDKIVRQVKVDRGAEYMTRITLARGAVARVSAALNRSSYYYNPKSTQSVISEYNNYTQSETYNLQIEKDLLRRIKASAGYRWYSDKQDFRGNLLDLWSELGELAFKINIGMTTKDTLGLDCILGVTSYYGLHGPAATERDLQTEIYNGRVRHFFNPQFWGELKTTYSNFHQIYIRSVNSASNNQNETYLLAANFGWSLHRDVMINQNFEIQANYISYDYDPGNTNTRNRIFRRGSTATRLEWRLSRNFIITPTYLYRYEDYGKLFWEENNWQQATGWDRRYHRLDLKVGYRLAGKLLFEPDHIWELRREYDHSFTQGDSTVADEIIRIQKKRDLKQTTVLSLLWNFDETQYISASYSRRDWHTSDRAKDINEFINISVRYLF